MARKSRKHLYDTPEEQKPKDEETLYFAGIYARTSSREQKGNSIENQQYIAERYIKENPDIKLRKVYVDYGISSFDRDRPGFDEMILDLESKSINCVIVKDISRFARDYLEAGDYTQRKFPFWSVRFIAVDNNFDSLRDDATQLRFVLQSLLSNYYSIDLSKKIKAVISNKQEAGTYVPAKLPYGYKKVRTEHGVEWLPDEQTSWVVRQIFSYALTGHSAFATAGKLNKENVPAPSSRFWSSGNILRILRNISYTGTLVTGKTRNDLSIGHKTKHLPAESWIRHHNNHVPIVDDVTFYSAQRLLSSRSSLISKQRHSEDFFCGKLFCGICGRKMRLKHAGNGSAYYLCPRRDEAGSSCTNKARNETKLKKLVFQDLAKKISDLQIYYQEALDYEKSAYFLRKKGEHDKMIQLCKLELERQLQVFTRIFEDSVIKHTNRLPDVQGLLQHLARVRTALQERLSNTIRMRNEYQDGKSSNSNKFLPYLMFGECNELTSQMLDELVEKVFVEMDGVRVVDKTSVQTSVYVK
jgi:DNA invertase Pin-like site-specific DNA recombinase